MQTGEVQIHPKFRLNGNSYTKIELNELAYDLVKEGSLSEQKIGTFLSDWLDEKSTLEVKTSGATGKPKTILLQKQHMVHSALATGEYFDLKEGSTALLCLPADYIAGKMMLVRSMVLGLELDYVEPSSRPLGGLIKSYDFAAMVPLQLKNSLNAIEIIKTLIVGGATVSRALEEKVQAKSTVVYETYGMTETITHVAVRDVRLSPVEVQVESNASQNRNNFKAIPNITFSKDDRNCLVIAAPKVAKQSVITNDIVNLISETEFEWLGRYDNIINSGGIKLVPEQIEAKLLPFLNNKFFVAGLPDEELGQQLVLVVEGEIDSKKILQELRESTSFESFEIPKHIYSLDMFEETDTGKIRRKENLRLIYK